MNKVLVISESTSVIESINEYFIGKEYDVSVLLMENIRKIPKEDVKLIICDFEQSMEYHQQVMQIFKIKSALDVPILACVENFSSRCLLNLLTFGVEDYIIKPFKKETLKYCVDSAIRFGDWYKKHIICGQDIEEDTYETKE